VVGVQAEVAVGVGVWGCRVGRWWRWCAALLVLVVVIVVSAAALPAGRGRSTARAVPGAAPSAEHAGGLQALSRVSAQAQSAISTTVGAGDGRFAPRRSGGGFELFGGGVAMGLGRGGVTVGGGGGRLSMAVVGFGRGARLWPLGAEAPGVRAGRVLYLHGGGVREWYSAGPLGIEQGFALARRPEVGSGAVTLALATGGLGSRLGGSGVEFLTRSGRVALRYGGLAAFDASGRRLPAWLSLSGSRLLLRVADRGARYPLRVDPLVQQAELIPSGTAYVAGWSVAADGDTVVVGAPGTTVGGHVEQGAVYVFARSGGVWKEQQELTASDGQEGDQLGGGGRSVAISGDTVVAGAWGWKRGNNLYQGAAYVFVRGPTGWVEQAKLTANDGGYNDQFGYSVAISGDTAVVGAPEAHGSHGLGAAYMFVRSGGVWTQTAEVPVPQPDTLCQQFCFFGWSVAIVAGVGVQSVVVGAPFAGNGAGAAFFFYGSGGRWSQPQKLLAADGAAGDQLGYSVAIGFVSGGTSQEVLAGAPLATVNSKAGKGAAYAFRGSAGGGWTQNKLTSYYGVAGENFGASTAISGNTTVVGAPGPIPCEFNCGCPPHCPSQFQGAAYVSPGTAQEQRLTASNGGANDNFGLAVAASGDMVVVGAPNPQRPSGTGAAYVFAPTVGRGAPPRARISAAKISSKHHAAKFTFKASGANGFQCALLRRPASKHQKKPKPHFLRCKSPKTYRHLKHGSYTFLVRALNAGRPGTAASKNFKIS
jgi:FG-GAP repeat